MATILSALPSCKSLELSDAYHSSLIARTSQYDTVVVRDSVFVSEKQRGDTVYLTRVEWRDRWRTRIERDTVVKTDSIVQVIQKPPERYVPKFYRHCTTICWIMIAVGIVYVVVRWRLILN